MQEAAGRKLLTASYFGSRNQILGLLAAYYLLLSDFHDAIQTEEALVTVASLLINLPLG